MNQASFPMGLATAKAAILDAPPAFIENLPVAIYACDAKGRVRWFNRRAAELWGRAPQIGDDSELFCGSYKLYTLDGQGIGRGETPMAHVLRTGEAVHGVEAVVERPEGSRVIAMVHIDPVLDADGTLIGAINCFHETTEVHRIRGDIADERGHFRQVLDALPVAVSATDAEGRVTFFNRAAADLAGRTPEPDEHWTQNWRFYSPNGMPLSHDEYPMTVTLRENRAVTGTEAVVERADGSRVPFLPYPAPLRDAAGRLVGAVNVMVDISERKEAETLQRNLMNELNHRVKNNMQMLISLLTASQREAQTQEARDVLAEAGRRVGAMAAAQHVMYAESTIHVGTQPFMEALVRNAQLAFGKQVDVHLTADAGELGNDSAVPLALILNELVSNCVRHGRQGRNFVTIHMSLTRDGDGWVLCVKDDGPGFTFEKPTRRSSGLGLVSGVARQLGGALAVTADGGACCTVRFGPRHGGAH